MAYHCYRWKQTWKMISLSLLLSLSLSLSRCIYIYIYMCTTLWRKRERERERMEIERGKKKARFAISTEWIGMATASTTIQDEGWAHSILSLVMHTSIYTVHTNRRRWGTNFNALREGGVAIICSLKRFAWPLLSLKQDMKSSLSLSLSLSLPLYICAMILKRERERERDR